MYDWKPVTFSDDTQTYYSASIEKNGSSHKIVYARQSEMGMTVAVTLTMKLIEHFRPQFMIMVGIAAGIARSDMAEQIYGEPNLRNPKLKPIGDSFGFLLLFGDLP